MLHDLYWMGQKTDCLNDTISKHRCGKVLLLDLFSFLQLGLISKHRGVCQPKHSPKNVTCIDMAIFRLCFPPCIFDVLFTTMVAPY
jgi:hypothetical protein